jgi:hypothetical protein
MGGAVCIQERRERESNCCCTLFVGVSGLNGFLLACFAAVGTGERSKIMQSQSFRSADQMSGSNHPHDPGVFWRWHPSKGGEAGGAGGRGESVALEIVVAWSMRSKSDPIVIKSQQVPRVCLSFQGFVSQRGAHERTCDTRSARLGVRGC